MKHKKFKKSEKKKVNFFISFYQCQHFCSDLSFNWTVQSTCKWLLRLESLGSSATWTCSILEIANSWALPTSINTEKHVSIWKLNQMRCRKINFPHSDLESQIECSQNWNCDCSCLECARSSHYYIVLRHPDTSTRWLNERKNHFRVLQWNFMDDFFINLWNWSALVWWFHLACWLCSLEIITFSSHRRSLNNQLFLI